MEIPLSLDGQDLRYLVDDEVILFIGEEKEKAGDNAVMIMTPQAPHGDKFGALSPREETLAFLQGVPKDLTHGDLDTTQEQHA